MLARAAPSSRARCTHGSVDAGLDRRRDPRHRRARTAHAPEPHRDVLRRPRPRSTRLRHCRQLVQALAHGVVYLDGGCQQLVDALQGVADARGVTITRAHEGRRDRGARRRVRGAHRRRRPRRRRRGRTRRAARSTSNACCTARARRCTGGPITSAPVYASALDLALRRLPDPNRRVVFGIDEPLYFSVHTPAARLVTEGPGEVAHLLWYGDRDDDPRPRLEALLDRAQPGWRDEVVDVRYGRRLVVAHGRPLPGSRVRGAPAGGRARRARASSWPATGWAPRECSPTPCSPAGGPPGRAARSRSAAMLELTA